MSGVIGEPALRGLRSDLNGRVLVSGDDGYEPARTVFNAMIDARPAVIAQCVDVADVRAAIAFGRDSGMPTAVRSGGHSVAGMSTVDDGLVIDLRHMKEITVDPDAGTARCGPGLTWGEFDRATQAHCLATTGGGCLPPRSLVCRSAAARGGSSASTGWRATTCWPSSW